MVGILEFTRARDRLLRFDDGDVDPVELCECVVGALEQVTRFDWCALLTVDPDTLLPSGGVVQGFDPALCAPFWDNELLDPDFQKFTDLARSAEPVGTLVEATDGDLARSPRYQKMWGPLGAADEMRIAFTAGTTCLAVGSFVRSGDDGPFPADELAHIRRLVPTASILLRRALSHSHRHQADHRSEVVILDGNGEVTSMTAGASALFDDLRINPIEEDQVPGILSTAATKARWSRTATRLTTRIRSRSGCWLRVQAAPLEGEVGAVAVTIEPARADDLVQIQIESYGLTDRETDIVLLLCRGLSAKEIAADLHISPHTVRDHVKAIYDKAGVSSRGELVATLFADQIMRRMETSVVHIG